MTVANNKLTVFSSCQKLYNLLNASSTDVIWSIVTAGQLEATLMLRMIDTVYFTAKTQNHI